MVDFGADVEEKGKNGCPPIIYAASRNHIECVEELLSLGANINSVDLYGNSALHSVMTVNDPKPIIALLLLHGASTRLANKEGNTPLQIALNAMNVAALEAFGNRGSIGGSNTNKIGDADNDGNSSISPNSKNSYLLSSLGEDNK